MPTREEYLIDKAKHIQELYSKSIPESTLESLEAYRVDHRPTGDFLEAVLSNDLMGAMGRADNYNVKAMFDICRYVYNELPFSSHGSSKNYQEWIRNKE